MFNLTTTQTGALLLGLPPSLGPPSVPSPDHMDPVDHSTGCLRTVSQGFDFAYMFIDVHGRCETMSLQVRQLL